jgi:hypothetical protein
MITVSKNGMDFSFPVADQLTQAKKIPFCRRNIAEIRSRAFLRLLVADLSYRRMRSSRGGRFVEV